ncbi:ArsR family transcriptional regulator [Halobellus sp. Atlit-38R]|uniref:MarR family transcriptional regulator n=1 Tax=Halobellus sp. Atlit-38R TaxID=2282131 RepID=UPI000EF22254|nr:MarR family transcriptional regulator [Halobellus sp. Atlit-38R]RLM83846.1 ArsR family transcriptional regulator [Halobellus sp. Atlit-38R]
MAGRKRQVNDSDILRVFALSPDPVLVASEVAEEIDMTRQGAFNRLQKLEEEGFVKSAMKSSARVWWITPEGKHQIASSG